MLDGFLNLNKPSGLTSHDCVAQVRKALKLKRVGHAGTLDPSAIGVLPIALGKATRLLQFLRQDKAYRATVRFGIQTTTDDLEGQVLVQQPVAGLTLADVEIVLDQFQGVIQQVPPNYSAIQVGGRRLYDLARAGEPIAVQARSVEVFAIKVLDWRSSDFPELDLEITCGPGTYIRAIARDLGQILKTGGTLISLTRTESCGFLLSESYTLDAVKAGDAKIMAMDATLEHLPVAHLTEAESRKWSQGQRVGWSPPESDVHCLANHLDARPYRIYHQPDQLLGIGILLDSFSGWELVPKVVLI